ncbi:cytochrome P450 [Pseudomonas sp. TE3610]
MRTIKQIDIRAFITPSNLPALYSQAYDATQILYDPGLNAYFIGCYDDVNDVLRSSSFTTTPLGQRAQPVMGERVLAQMDGSEHHSKRKGVLSGLTGHLFREKYSTMITEITESILKRFLPAGKIDLISEFGKEYGVKVTLRVLGLPTERHEQVAAWHHGIANFITSLDLTDTEREFSLDCSRRLIQYLTPLIEHKIQHPDESLISAIYGSTPPEQKMTTAELVALVLNILLAATEPADKTLAYLFKHLLEQPELFQRVVKDRSLLTSAINETLRMSSPVQLIPRQAEQGATLPGVKFSRGDLVFCMLGAANRDPSAYHAASEFRIDRRGESHSRNEKISPHLAFGTGPHVCVGAAFSMMQIRHTANLILDHMKDLRLAPDCSFHEDGFYTRGFSALTLLFSPTTLTSTPDKRPTDAHA